MDMPKPTDAHRKLEPLAGKWSGTEKISPLPWDPQGGTAAARIQNRVALDGFALIQDYEQERNGAVNYRGYGVFRYDMNANAYVFHWFDSMGMGTSELRGDCKDNIFTLTGKNPQGLSRATFDVKTEGRYSFKLEGSQDGKQWMTFMEGNYKRDV